MAFDPRIALAARPGNQVDILGTFQKALTGAKALETAGLQNQLLQQQVDQQTAAQPFQQQIIEGKAQSQEFDLSTARDQQRLANLGRFAPVLKPALEAALQSGNNDQARTLLTQNIARNQRLGLDSNESVEALQRVEQGDIQGALDLTNTVIDLDQRARRGKPFAPTVGTPQTDKDTGQRFIEVFDPNKNQAKRINIPGAFQETPEAKRTAIENIAQRKEKAKRVRVRKKEFGDKRQLAARSQVPIRSALRLAQKADQGLTGALKLQLSRVIPGIDTSDEAALDSALNQLALDELQKFRGPTTDFEFQVVRDIAGSLGQSKEANVARIKSLDRNNWFIRREARQFDQWIKGGGDPDQFEFNIAEPLPLKDGTTVSLEDLRDTAAANHLTIEETIKRFNQ